jgi:RHS repeat-associated protein
MLSDLGLIHMNGRVYDPVLGRFLSSDSVVQDAGDSQAYNRFSYCGNNPVNAIDPSGHSWFSRALKFLRKATRDLLIGPLPQLNPLAGPINRLYQWGESHQQELEIAAIIIISIYTAGAASSFLYVGGTTAGVGGATTTVAASGILANCGLPAMVCSGLAGAAGGAVGGFVSGVGLESMNGGSIGQDLEAGLKGAEYGAISGGISGGISGLNSQFPDLNNLTPRALVSPFSDVGGKLMDGTTLSGAEWDGTDIEIIAGKGLEGAITAKLENQNVRAGFWGGIDSSLGGLAPEFGDVVSDDLAKGVLGGLSSMNMKGEGFGNGFWNAEAKAAGGQLVDKYDVINGKTSPWLKAVYGSVASGMEGGLKSKLGGTAVSLGFRTALYTSLVSSGINKLDSSFKVQSRDKFGDSSGPVGKGYALVQPKTTTNKHTHKTTTSIPLTSVNGGTWLDGANWAQLY